jgi:hypothetical protein
LNVNYTRIRTASISEYSGGGKVYKRCHEEWWHVTR